MKPASAKPEIITRNGKAVSVILPIKEYQEMNERLEEVEDLAWLERARKKPLRYRPLEEWLRQDGRDKRGLRFKAPRN
jgi:PHD/YefM family antitoxin component YafN of YafNO toxin-antitoxin module